MKRTLFAWAVVLAASGLSCGPGKRAKGPDVAGQSRAAPAAMAGVDMTDFDGPGAALPVVQVPGRSLDADETFRVLKRLAPMKVQPTDQTEFALRDRSLPPPRPGDTLKMPFPPPPTAAARPAGQDRPLEVLRFAPEGDVPLVPQVSATFSQPMVEISSLQEIAKIAIPVKLSPQPPGNWRWLGTQTVVFDPRVPRDGRPDDADGAPPQQRLPASTTYTVEIPAGTRSALGATLATGKTWTFQTPTVTLQASHPQWGPQGLEPVLFARFDQAIDAAKVLATISVDGRKGDELRLATAAEIEADPSVKSLVEGSEKGRWLAFRAVKPLPRATSIRVNVGPGTPSAEGPRTTTAAQGWGFRTYGPMELEDYGCGWRCGPGQGFWLRFSNPIQEDAFEPGKLRITPGIQKLQITSGGNSIQVDGRTRARTTYSVVVPAGLKDIFGQVTEKDITVKIKVDPALPAFSGPEQAFMVLDPTARPRIPVFTINHKSVKVRVHRVTVKDWLAFRTHMRKHDEDLDDTSSPPGEVVINQTIPVSGTLDEMVETDVDLSAALRGGVGQLIVVIEPTVKRKKDRWGWRRREEVRAWVEVTKLGLSAFTDAEEMVGWVNDLGDGKSLAGVELSLWPRGATAKSGPDGIARLALGAQDDLVLVAKRGGDVALLPRDSGWWGDAYGWTAVPRTETLRWLVFDDRHMYRPDEEVHFKGFVRRWDARKGGSVNGFAAQGVKAKYKVIDSRNNTVLEGEVALSDLGAFDGSFKLPKTINLGATRIQFQADGPIVSGSQYNHSFSVEEFRRPEFEVNASVAEGVHYQGDKVKATVKASYYAGGALPGAQVNWQVSQTATNFVPPGREDWSFGTWSSWWSRSRGGGGRNTYQSGTTDASGAHTIELTGEKLEPGRPVVVRAEASVTDVNRQAWSASASYLAHAGDLYVGLRSDRYFVQRGQPLLIDAVVADIDGKLVAHAIKMRAARQAWVQTKGKWEEKEVDVQDCAPTSSVSADKPVRCTFQTPEGGQYKVTALVTDAKSRETRSELQLWVAGGEEPPQRELEQDAATLVPDKKEYQPGDVAEIFVQSPFSPAEALVTVRRQGLLRTERVAITTGSTTLKVAIEEAHTPNVIVQVDLVGSAVRKGDDGVPDPKLKRRPAFATGSVSLPVPPRSRSLKLEVAPTLKELEPGGETDVTVTVTDASKQPVAGGEVVLVVVDESVLALSGYELPDPLAFFYAQRGGDMEDSHLRASVLLAKPEPPEIEIAEPPPPKRPSKSKANKDDDGDSSVGYGMGSGRASGGMYRVTSPTVGAAMPKAKKGGKNREEGGADNSPDTPVAVRSDFNALALFAPKLKTDAAGRVTAHVKVPDNLTRYRVMAIAVAGERQFGSGDAAITARLPLMVRPSAPRFLNFGDKLQLPVVVQNQTDQPMVVDVAVRGANAALLGAVGGQAGNAAGRRITVPARDRVEVRFPAAAARAGTARFQVGGVSGNWADAAEVELPVWTPATTEAFATYGVVDQGAIAQPVKPPGDVYKQFGGLEITTSSTELQALTDAVLYLVTYPFECSEQLSAKIISVAALRDVLSAFKAEGLPPPKELIAAVDRDIKRLVGRQNWDGGFGFWRRGEDVWPFVTINAMHALSRAKDKGFKVPDDTLSNGMRYLRDIDRHIPWYYGREARRAVQAYALYTLQRLGELDAKKALTVFDEAPLDETQMETVAWLYPVLSAAGGKGDAAAANRLDKTRRHLTNRVSEEAGTAHWTTDYGDSAYLLLASDRRVDGILLEGLIGDQPESDLIPKVVRGLLAHKTKGRWGSTQESSWVLLAMDRYFHVFEKDTPDFTARAWLGQYFAGEHAFKGRTTERAHIDVPMAVVQEAGKQDLIIGKEGTGRLYYRIGMQYAPKDLRLPPSEHGFTVLRVYEAVDKPDDVSKDKDGVWHVKAGARVRVRLTMVAQSRRYHVALVDPLPAGLEVMNSALKVTGTVPEDPKAQAANKYWYWFRPWFQHQNLRDERVEAFTTLLWEGVHDYSYVARATTPGNFVAPPTKAEEMYMPETFGRSAGDRVIVE